MLQIRNAYFSRKQTKETRKFKNEKKKKTSLIVSCYLPSSFLALQNTGSISDFSISSLKTSRNSHCLFCVISQRHFHLRYNRFTHQARQSVELRRLSPEKNQSPNGINNYYLFYIFAIFFRSFDDGNLTASSRYSFERTGESVHRLTIRKS